MGRNHLAHSTGDNAVPAAVGYNFPLLLRWLAVLWTFIQALSRQFRTARRRLRPPDRLSSRTTSDNVVDLLSGSA
jgi:hypothetical protein